MIDTSAFQLLLTLLTGWLGDELELLKPRTKPRSKPAKRARRAPKSDAQA